MKLSLKIQTAKPRVEKVKLTAETAELFDRYLQFYQQKFSATLCANYVIAEMMVGFIESDRDFSHWNREQIKLPTERTGTSLDKVPSCKPTSTKKS